MHVKKSDGQILLALAVCASMASAASAAAPLDKERRPDAEAPLDQMIAPLRTHVEQRHALESSPAQEHLQRLEEELTRLRESAANARATLERVTREAAAHDLRLDEDTSGATEQLHETRRAIELELAGKQARRQALLEAVEALEQEVRTRVEEDPIAAELASILELRQKDLDRVRELVARQAAGLRQVEEAAAELSRAKVELLTRREAAAQASGMDAITALNRELLAVSTDTAELEGKRRHLRDLLGRMRRLRELQAVQVQAQIKLQRAEAQIGAREREIAERAAPAVELQVEVLEAPPVQPPPATQPDTAPADSNGAS